MGRVTVTIEDGPSDITFQALLGAVVEAAGGSRTDCMAYARGAGWVKAYHVRLDLTVVVQHESAQVPEGMPGVFTVREGSLMSNVWEKIYDSGNATAVLTGWYGACEKQAKNVLALRRVMRRTDDVQVVIEPRAIGLEVAAQVYGQVCAETIRRLQDEEGFPCVRYGTRRLVPVAAADAWLAARAERDTRGEVAA